MTESESVSRTEAILAAESERIRGLLHRYLSPRVANAVLTERHAAQRGSQTCEVSILICDLRGFTRFAELNTPAAVEEHLNDFLEQMTEVVFKYDGVLDKYTGDGLIAVFGVPYPQPDHAERAIYSGLEMQARHQQLLQTWRTTTAAGLEMGVGITSGNVLAGNFGSRQRVDYTVIGHIVNLAARLTGIAPGGYIVIDEATRDASAPFAVTDLLGPAHLKNVSQDVTAHRLIGVQPQGGGLCLGCGKRLTEGKPMCVDCGTPRGVGLAAAGAAGGLLTAASVRATLTSLRKQQGPRLIAIAGPHQGLDMAITFPCAIGREALTNSLVLSLDTAISRRHAVLRLEDSGTVVVADLGSQNGTYLNSARVEVAPLRNRDILTFGRTSLVIDGLSA
jgi:class 3 adenylate cyclase